MSPDPLPPAAKVGRPRPAPRVVRDGAYVRTPVMCVWPPRCVQCNVAVPATQVDARAAWYPRWTRVALILAFALPVVGHMLLMPVMLGVRRQVRVDIGLCEAHHLGRRRRAWALGVIGAIWFAALIVGLAFRTEAQAVSMLIGSALFLAFTAYAAGTWNLLRVHRVEEGVAWVKVSRVFLNSLPVA